MKCDSDAHTFFYLRPLFASRVFTSEEEAFHERWLISFLPLIQFNCKFHLIPSLLSFFLKFSNLLKLITFRLNNEKEKFAERNSSRASSDWFVSLRTFRRSRSMRLSLKTCPAIFVRPNSIVCSFHYDRRGSDPFGFTRSRRGN